MPAAYWWVLDVLNCIHCRGSAAELLDCGTDRRSALQNGKALMDFGGLWFWLCHILHISQKKVIEDDFKSTLHLKCTSVYAEQDDYFKT